MFSYDPSRGVWMDVMGVGVRENSTVGARLM